MGDIPLIAFEGILVAVGFALFYWWQMRDLKKAKEKREAEAAQQQERSTPEDAGHPPG